MKYIHLLLVFLAGCSLNSQKNKKPVVDNDTYVTSVDKSQRTHMLYLTNNVLSKHDEASLRDLADQYINTGVRQIVLTPIVRSKNELNMFDIHLESIKEIFIRSGIISAYVYIHQPVVVTGKKSRSGIKIDSYTYSVKLPTAKEWKYDIGDIDETKELPNFGVSNEYNLGLMIDNPKDLVDPDPIAPFDSKSAIQSVRKIIGNTRGTQAGGQQRGNTSSSSSTSSSTSSSNLSSSTGSMGITI